MTDTAAPKRRRACERVDVIAQGLWQSAGGLDVLISCVKYQAVRLWRLVVRSLRLQTGSRDKATTILQLALTRLTGCRAGAGSRIHVRVPPRSTSQKGSSHRRLRRLFRHVKARLEKSCDQGEAAQHIPNHAPICDVCRWYKVCDATRRAMTISRSSQGFHACNEINSSRGMQPALPGLAYFRFHLSKSHSTDHVSLTSECANKRASRWMGVCRARLFTNCSRSAENTGFCRLPVLQPQTMFVDLEGDPS